MNKSIFRWSRRRLVAERSTPRARFVVENFIAKDSAGITPGNDHNIAGEFFNGESPNVVLNSLADGSSTGDQTPTLSFTGTDSEDLNDVSFQIQLSENDIFNPDFNDLTTGIIGRNTAGGSGGSVGSTDVIIFSKYTTSSSGKVISGHANIASGSGNPIKIKLVIYSDESGNPKNLISISESVTITNTTLTFIDFVFSTENNVVLISGTPYWIGYVADSSSASISFSFLSGVSGDGAQYSSSSIYDQSPKWQLDTSFLVLNSQKNDVYIDLQTNPTGVFSDKKSDIDPGFQNKNYIFSDNFDDNSFDTGKWAQVTVGTPPTLSESGQKLVFTPSSVANGSLEVSTIDPVNITTAAIVAKIPQVADSVATTTELIYYDADFVNAYELYLYNGSLYCGTFDLGTVASIAYNSPTMVYWSIREENGYIYFEYSADGLSWTTIHSMAKESWSVTNGYPGIIVNKFAADATPGETWIEDFYVVDRTDPFVSGQEVTFTPSSSLAPGTYYWRVRAKDIGGSGVYGGWSETRSFTITESIVNYNVTATAKARVKSSGITKTITAKARIKQLAATKTVSAKARVKRAAVASTVTAKTRIKSSGVTKTITAKARIKSFATRTVTARSRVKQLALTKTATAKARVKTSGTTVTVTAKARIKNTASQTVTAKTRVKQLSVTKTATAKARVKLLAVQQTVTAKASIASATTTNSATVTAKARVKTAGTTKSITSRARVKLTGIVKTVTSKARVKLTAITTTVTSKARVKQLAISVTVTAKSRIKQLAVTKTVTAKARIKSSGVTATVTAKARIKNTSTATVQVKSRVKNFTTQSVTAKARVNGQGITNTITAKSRVKQVAVQQTVTAKANITSATTTNSATVTAKARVKTASTTTSITAKARVKLIGIVKTVTSKAMVKLAAITTTVTSKARIKTAGTTATVTARTRVKRLAVESTITAKSSVKRAAENVTTTAKARVKMSGTTKTIQAKARIKQALTVSVYAKARVLYNRAVSVTAKARVISFGTTVTISAKARVKLNAATVTISAKANIFNIGRLKFYKLFNIEHQTRKDTKRSNFTHQDNFDAQTGKYTNRPVQFK